MFKNYRQNKDGNVAMMFAICLTTLLIGIGAAVDFTGASKQQQSLQDMVDAATLAAAKANTDKQSELNKIVEEFVKAHNTDSLKIKLDVRIVDDEVVVTGTTVYDTSLMGLVGKPKMDVTAQAASPIASLTPVMLSLVLDTTTSMEGDNIAALKVAAASMIDELEKFKSPVAVSVVPFGQYVNVGTNYKKASWLDVSEDGKTTTKEVCSPERNLIKARECKKTGNIIYYDDIRDGRNFGKKSREEEICTPAEYDYTGNEVCKDVTTKKTWYGCVGSRQSPYNEQAAFKTVRIKGVMNVGCGTTLLPLTKNMTEVRAKIASLSTNGSTYMPSGAIWGWRSLQDASPLETDVNLTEGKAKKAKPTKVLILMTDGENTLSQGGSEDHLHNANNKTDANKRTAALCTAAKADGIQIFTIGYRMSDKRADSRKILQACATTQSQYYSANNAAQLKDAFKDIAGKLDFTRLAM